MRRILMSMSFLVPLLLLAGCGDDLHGIAYSPSETCLGPYIASSGTLDPGRLVTNEEMLVGLFTSAWSDKFGHSYAPIFGSRDDFCRGLGAEPIIFHWKRSIICGWELGTGCTTDVINLSSEGTALLHELLHVYEVRHLVVDSFMHPWWPEKGYDEMASSYASAQLGPMIGPNGETYPDSP